MSTGLEIPLSDSTELARRALEPEQCALIVVDIQEKLLPPIWEKERLVRNAQLLIRLAGILKIPALVTTQYMKGLGGTVPEVAQLLPDTPSIDKLMFSCFGSDALLQPAQALARPAHHGARLRNGNAYLRDADRAGSVARRLPGPRGLGRGQLADGTQLAHRPRAHACRRSHSVFD